MSYVRGTERHTFVPCAGFSVRFFLLVCRPDGIPKYVGVERQQFRAITPTCDDDRVSIALWDDCGAVSESVRKAPGLGLEAIGSVLCSGSREFVFVAHGYFRLEVVPKSAH